MGESSHEAVGKAMEDAAGREAEKIKRSVRPLSVIAGICPLLGLLGTVYGMIDAFQNRGCRRSGQDIRVGRWDLPSLDQYCRRVDHRHPRPSSFPMVVHKADRAIDHIDESGTAFVVELRPFRQEGLCKIIGKENFPEKDGRKRPRNHELSSQKFLSGGGYYQYLEHDRRHVHPDHLLLGHDHLQGGGNRPYGKPAGGCEEPVAYPVHGQFGQDQYPREWLLCRDGPAVHRGTGFRMDQATGGQEARHQGSHPLRSGCQASLLGVAISICRSVGVPKANIAVKTEK